MGRKFVRRTNYDKRVKTFDWQFLSAADDVIKSLTRPKSSFRYTKEYMLKSEGVVACGTANLLVEWFWREDRYAVQAINVPVMKVLHPGYTGKNLVRKKVPIDDHYINPRKQMLLLFEIYKDARGISARVRHIPTFVEFKGWSNDKLPELQLQRKGHENELIDFLGNKLQIADRASNSPFEGLLLDRIEKTVT